jgi:hypothetical protein
MSRRKDTSDFIRRKQLDGGLDTIPITVETDVHDRKLRALLGRGRQTTVRENEIKSAARMGDKFDRAIQPRVDRSL